MNMSRHLIGGAVMIVIILLAAYSSNQALDAFGISNEPAATIEQRRERARERQWDWDNYREPRGRMN